MFEFAGALPYSFFNNILQPLVSGWIIYKFFYKYNLKWQEKNHILIW
jgi:hypothetical protein